MRQIIFVIISFFQFIVATTLYSEPTPSIRLLMNEPASLFDIGIIMMREANITQ
jgi:hypothetical protein